MNLSLSFGMTNGELKSVEPSQLRAALDFKSAVALCIRLSPIKRTQNDLAALAGINPCQFSKVLNGKFHLPGDKIPVIERLCANTAITQWLAKQHSAQLHFETLEEKVARLEAELAKVAA
jgi:DNA-binding transcriptional regulator YdaS (Cro superfamily)